MEVGKSTLGSQKYWYDDVNGRINKEERGKLLGSFDTGDQLLTIYADGTYELAEFDPSSKIDVRDLLLAVKFKPKAAISSVYFEGEKQWTMVKRFLIETTTIGQRFKFITDHKDSKLYWASIAEDPSVEYGYMSQRQKVTEELQPAEFIEVKGWKAIGNKLIDKKLISIRDLDQVQETDEGVEEDAQAPTRSVQPDLFASPSKKSPAKAKSPAKSSPKAKSKSKPTGKPHKERGKKSAGEEPRDGFLFAGDTIEFDF